jgi:hypothetical protein
MFREMCQRIVQKQREISVGETIVVLLKGPASEFEVPCARAVFQGSLGRESAKWLIDDGRAEEVIVPYVSGFHVRSEKSGEVIAEKVITASALQGVLSYAGAGEARRFHVITTPATEEQHMRLDCEEVPVVLGRELESHDWARWQRCNPPSPGEEVWTTDQFEVRKGRYEWDPEHWDPFAEAETGQWKDLEGRDLVVRYWKHVSDEKCEAPKPPRLLYRHFEMPEMS